MRFFYFRKANHFAVSGFLLPFAALAVIGMLTLINREALHSLGFLVPYLSIVPLLLILGLFLSIKSIPLVDELGDRDYAFSGLTVNILFLVLYLVSLIYFLFPNTAS